jgi:hypothetical protein
MEQKAFWNALHAMKRKKMQVDGSLIHKLTSG